MEHSAFDALRQRIILLVMVQSYNERTDDHVKRHRERINNRRIHLALFSKREERQRNPHITDIRPERGVNERRSRCVPDLQPNS